MLDIKVFTKVGSLVKWVPRPASVKSIIICDELIVIQRKKFIVKNLFKFIVK